MQTRQQRIVWTIFALLAALTLIIIGVRVAHAADVPPITGYAKVVAPDDPSDFDMVPTRAGCTLGSRSALDVYDPGIEEGWDHRFRLTVNYNRCPTATVVENRIARDTITGSRADHHCRSLAPPAVIDAIHLNVGDLAGSNPGDLVLDCHDTDHTYKHVFDGNLVVNGTNDNQVSMDWKIEWRPGSDASGNTGLVVVPEP